MDLNSDLGESFGIWELGDDAAENTVQFRGSQVFEDTIQEQLRDEDLGDLDVAEHLRSDVQRILRSGPDVADVLEEVDALAKLVPAAMACLCRSLS